MESIEDPMSNHQDSHKLSPQLLSAITIHGFVLWASMGFLIPVGILTIRMSNTEKSAKRLKSLFYVHAVSQTLSVLLVTIAAVMSIRSFENSFNNTHQKIGVVLYGAVWLQALIGILRPHSRHRGMKRRNMWFFVHWAFGTTITVLGIINVYTGLQAYKKKTSINNIRIWSILFTCQVSLMFFFYLFQDKWEYIQKQGVVSSEEIPIKPIDQYSSNVSKTELQNEHC